MEVTASEMDRPVESESFNVSESERVNQADCEVFGLGVRNGPSVRIRELFKVSESEGEVLQELDWSYTGRLEMSLKAKRNDRPNWNVLG